MSEEIEKLKKEQHENEKTILKLQMELKDRDRQLEENKKTNDVKEKVTEPKAAADEKETKEAAGNINEIRDFKDHRDQKQNEKNRR